MTRWSAPFTALAIVLAGLAAASLTPEADTTSIGGFAGLPRLALYAAAGALLGLSAAPALLDVRLRSTCLAPVRAYWLLAVGVVASAAVALVNARRLLVDIADPLGPWLWLASMLVLLAYTLLPLVQRIGWEPLWRSRTVGVEAPRWLAPALLVGLLVVAAALRLPDLGGMPRGINPDEGDRAATAFDVLRGVAPSSWFGSAGS